MSVYFDNLNANVDLPLVTESVMYSFMSTLPYTPLIAVLQCILFLFYLSLDQLRKFKILPSGSLNWNDRVFHRWVVGSFNISTPKSNKR